jgi:hypothetical protein
MTEHGFGKIKITASTPPPGIIKAFARKISKVPGVIRTHTQKPKGSTGPWKDNQIIFEFGHVLTHYPEEYPGGHADFFKRIKSITVPPKWRISELEHWIKEDSVP